MTYINIVYNNNSFKADINFIKDYYFDLYLSLDESNDRIYVDANTYYNMLTKYFVI